MPEPSFAHLLRDPDPWAAPEPLPLPVHSERLVLRMPEAGDAEALLAALDVARDKVSGWMVWARTDNRTLAECHYTIERFRRECAEPECVAYPILYFDRRSGEVLGGSGYHAIERGLRKAEIGFWVRPDRWGEGIATEATAALITAGLTPQEEGGWGFRRMTLLCAAINTASERVARKLGLRLEERSRLSRYLDTIGYHDSLGFGVLADEWDFGAQRARPGIGGEDSP